MNYLSKHEYERLYARYVGRREADLLYLAGNLRNKIVVDLCGGAGRMSLAARRKGARHVILVDSCPEMLDEELRLGSLHGKRLSIEVTSVERWISTLHEEVAYLWTKKGELRQMRIPFIDVILCCQGINYWFDEGAVRLLAKGMKKGGMFLFNTFNTEPPPIPVPKEYVFKGKRYMELSWLVKSEIESRVQHVQICEGMNQHTTSFLWIPPKEFSRVLRKWFKVHVLREGTTDVYACVRK